MAGAGDPHRPPPPRGTVGWSYRDMEEQTESHEEYISRLLGERTSEPQGDPSGEPSCEPNPLWLHNGDMQIRDERQALEAARRAQNQKRAKAERKAKKKRRRAALALQLEQGTSQPQQHPSGESQPPQDPSLHRPQLIQSPEPARARVRQSVLYADRPRRSRRPSQDKLQVEEHAGMVSSREFEALTLGQSPPTHDSAHRIMECAYDTANSDTAPEIIMTGSESIEVVDKLKDESDDLEELRRSAKEYRAEYDSLSRKEWRAKLSAAHAANLAAILERDAARRRLPDALKWAKWESPPVPMQKPWTSPGSQLLCMLGLSSENDESSVVAHPRDEHLSRQHPPGSQPGSNDSDEDYEELSDQQIIENGRKWMSEEVMVAFKKYTESCADQTGLDYQFGELLHQCLNVEDYYKTYHHFNFTMKMKDPTSCVWRVELYFAEIRRMFRMKHYFCCPLEPLEDGHCYGCKNQGVNDLKHPATGGFDQGCATSTFPYM